MERAAPRGMGDCISAVLVVVAVVLAPMWGGSTHPPATLWLSLAGTLALAAALFSDPTRPLLLPPPALPLLALSAFSLAQLIPLPPTVSAMLNPVETEVRRLALRGLSPPSRWLPITADAAATMHQAARLFGLSALAIASARLARIDNERGRAWLRSALYVALFCVLLASLLMALGVTLPRPIVPLPSTRALLVFPLVNPNHAAAFFCMVLPLALAQITRTNMANRLALVALTVAANVALVCTLSRAGIVLGVAAQAATLWMLARGVGARRRRSVRLLVLLSSLALVVGLLIGAGPLGDRLHAVDASDGRWSAWRDGIKMLRDHLLVGAGRGAFPFAFARYSEAAARLRYDYVECEPLQIAIDVGVPALLLFALTLVLAARRCAFGWRLSQPSTTAKAAAIGLLALALHNLVDFSIEGGGVAAAACALSALAFPGSGWRMSRWLGALLVVAALALVSLAASGTFPTADTDATALRAASASGASKDVMAGLEASAFNRHPSDGLLADMAARRLLSDGDARVYEWLSRALIVGPRDAIAHRLTARVLAASGRFAQAAGEFRSAIEDASDADRATLYADVIDVLAPIADGELLIDALPSHGDARHTVLTLLHERGRWPAFFRLALAILDENPDDAPALKQLVIAQLATGRIEGLETHATRLAQLDGTPGGTMPAARALVAAGKITLAEAVLDQALTDRATPDLVEARVQLAIDRGDLDRGATIVDSAIMRAIDVYEKARLHRLRATIDDRAGRTTRAAWERAEANRLSP